MAKSADKEYFNKHIINILYHVIGDHKECDDLYCNSTFKEYFTKIKLTERALNTILNYL